jgi:hypothetical protein
MLLPQRSVAQLFRGWRIELAFRLGALRDSQLMLQFELYS